MNKNFRFMFIHGVMILNKNSMVYMSFQLMTIYCGCCFLLFEFWTLRSLTEKKMLYLH